MLRLNKARAEQVFRWKACGGMVEKDTKEALNWFPLLSFFKYYLKEINGIKMSYETSKWCVYILTVFSICPSIYYHLFWVNIESFNFPVAYLKLNHNTSNASVIHIRGVTIDCKWSIYNLVRICSRLRNLPFEYHFTIFIFHFDNRFSVSR